MAEKIRVEVKEEGLKVIYLDLHCGICGRFLETKGDPDLVEGDTIQIIAWCPNCCKRSNQ